MILIDIVVYLAVLFILHAQHRAQLIRRDRELAEKDREIKKLQATIRVFSAAFPQSRF